MATNGPGTMTPSQRALRAEARAWRRIGQRHERTGRAIDLNLPHHNIGTRDCPGCAMWRRLNRHTRASVILSGNAAIFAYWLALECESAASRVPPESAR